MMLIGLMVDVKQFLTVAKFATVMSLNFLFSCYSCPIRC